VCHRDQLQSFFGALTKLHLTLLYSFWMDNLEIITSCIPTLRFSTYQPIGKKATVSLYLTVSVTYTAIDKLNK
jgi:hypothetical protein